MSKKQHVEYCEGCKISRKRKKALKRLPGKIVIPLKGNWTLNHYGGSEGFLGWLVLQPRCHRTKIEKLSRKEAAALGGNIKKIDAALRDYWKKKFPQDPIKRVYVVYFWEGNLDEPEPEKSYHLHFHLIPRTKKMGKKLLRQYTRLPSDGPPYASTILAWNIHKLTKSLNFPDKYRRHQKDAHKALMKYLKKQLRVGPHSR